MRKCFLSITGVIALITFVWIQQQHSSSWHRQRTSPPLPLKSPGLSTRAVTLRPEMTVVTWIHNLNLTQLLDLYRMVCGQVLGFTDENRLTELILSRFMMASQISHDRFRPGTILNDQILLFHMQIIDRVDRFIRTAAENDADIDLRRKHGQHTNLKLSEFRGITEIQYGAKLCNSNYGANVTVAVFVVTKPDDFRLRSLIRNTWARPFQTNFNSTPLYFVFGQPNTADREHVQELIRMESLRFGDIIVWWFEEDYFRLTIKSIGIVRWASLYCPLANAIFKVDGDAMINYDNLMRFLRRRRRPTNDNDDYNDFSIYGHLWNRSVVIRTKTNKFYTDINDYPKKYYPLYAGSAWLLTGRGNPLFLYLVAVQQAMPALLWEDIYMTGILPLRLRDAGIRYGKYRLPGFQFNVPPRSIDACLYRRSTILTEQIKEKNLETIWRKVHQPLNATQLASQNCTGRF